MIKTIKLSLILLSIIFASLVSNAQHIVSVQFEPGEILPDATANVIIHSHIPNLDCTTESILVFAACGAISLEMYYGAWIWPGDCYRTDTINVGPFCEGLTYFSVDMYFPDFVKTDSFDTIISVETVTHISSVISGNGFYVHPNPFKESITIASNITLLEPMDFIVTDLSGRIIENRKLYFMGNMHTLNFPGLSDGTYIYNINKDGIRLDSGLIVKTR